MANGAVPPDSAEFWSYIDAAEGAIARRAPRADATATRLLMVLNRTSQALIADLESRFQRPAGLNWSQFRILQSLWLLEPMQAKDVAAVTGMSRALLSASLRPLVAAGLVATTPDPADGRAIRLSVTPAGIELIADVYTRQNAAEQQWIEELDNDERAVLEGLLRRLSGSAG